MKHKKVTKKYTYLTKTDLTRLRNAFFFRCDMHEENREIREAIKYMKTYKKIILKLGVVK